MLALHVSVAPHLLSSLLRRGSFNEEQGDHLENRAGTDVQAVLTLQSVFLKRFGSYFDIKTILSLYKARPCDLTRFHKQLFNCVCLLVSVVSAYSFLFRPKPHAHNPITCTCV